MSVKKFKFVSPGVFIDEIDNSQLPGIPAPVGPVVIGRTRRGPAFLPTRVAGFSDFIDIFGSPVAGPTITDVWRDGTPLAPTYAAYAAQAWLKNNSPCTIIKVLGDQHPNADATGYAGFQTGTGGGASAIAKDTGGAYALLLWNDGDDGSQAKGLVAAVWHLSTGTMQLSSSTARGGWDITESEDSWNNDGTSGQWKTWGGSGSNLAVNSTGNSVGEFTAFIKNSSNENVEKLVFNFNKNSDRYIRKVFNTNPSLTNSNVLGSDTGEKNYYLAQTYDRLINEVITGSATQQVGCLVGLGNGAVDGEGANYMYNSRPGQTGWFISQDLRTTPGLTTAAGGSNSAEPDDDAGVTNNILDPVYNPEKDTSVTKLFKLHTLGGGQWEQENFKISIQEIKKSTSQVNPYGKFTVVLRRIDDDDSAVKVIEQFSNCNLNPNSPDYVARKIGDAYVQYDNTRRRLVEYGNWPNNSKYFRVEMNTATDAGLTDPRLLPFGVYGPVRPRSFRIYGLRNNASRGSDIGETLGFILAPGTTAAAETQAPKSFLRVGAMGGGAAELPYGNPEETFAHNVAGEDTAIFAGIGHTGIDVLVEWPRPVLRVSASQGASLSDPTEAYFGVDTSQYGPSPNFDHSYKDILFPLPKAMDSFTAAASTTDTEYSFIFSLDDVSGSNDLSEYAWVSGSRGIGESVTAKSGSYEKILDAGYDRFTTCFHGGFDGFDIREKEPITNHRGTVSATGGGQGLNSDATEKTSYAYYSVKKAMDIISDSEYVEMNLATAPGVQNQNLTQHLVNLCEDRGDALAIIDIDGGYTHAYDDGTTEQSRISSTEITSVVNNMRTRGLDSSYGATYYPWVRVRDSVGGGMLWVPPSVAALGTLGSSESKSAPWFAPAGFNRGGLTEGAAGVPVLGVRTKLTSKDRDKLYEVNINPIASFPAEGIVVFGQKTLQITPSALDRINVRRLLIFLKREISRISANILFDQNVGATWTRFLNKVKPFLDSVKTGLGLTEYKVVLDRTTTTPDLIDRNILYAKIFLKPARAIEFIALDFTIMRTGAAFED